MTRWSPQEYAAYIAKHEIDLKTGTMAADEGPESRLQGKIVKGENMKIYIGIDPGQTGAMAVIVTDIAGSPAGFNYPKTVVFDYDDGNALSFLQEWTSPNRIWQACLEKVHSMPKQGVSSSFKFGTNFGIWIGRLEALGIPYDFVTPQKWQKVMFDSMTKGDRKAMSLDRARRLFPDMSDVLKRKKDHNRAEALLIAEYCRRIDK